MGVGISPLAEKFSIEEDELRREIGALKRLVLNRYYFRTFISRKLVLNIYVADDHSCPQFQGPQVNSYNNVITYCMLSTYNKYNCDMFIFEVLVA